VLFDYKIIDCKKAKFLKIFEGKAITNDEKVKFNTEPNLNYFLKKLYNTHLPKNSTKTSKIDWTNAANCFYTNKKSSLVSNTLMGNRTGCKVTDEIDQAISKLKQIKK